MKKLSVIAALFLSGGLTAKQHKNMTYVHLVSHCMTYGERFHSDPAETVANSVIKLLLKKYRDNHVIDDLNALKNKNVNEVERGGYTALGAAIQRHSAAVVKLLLDAGANPNLIVVYDGCELQSFLHQAISKDTEESLKILEALIEYGADINYDSPAVGYNENPKARKRIGTPLNYAVQEYLKFDELKNKIKPSYNTDYNTEMRIRELEDHLKLLAQKIILLVEKGADQAEAPLFHKVAMIISRIKSL